MEHLSGLDASFLYLETPAQLMHVCGLTIVDPATVPGGYSFDGMRAEIGRRIDGVPAFTFKIHKVPLGLDHPVWVRDDHFEIENHIHRVALPTPGGYDQLVELAGHLAEQPLDRSQPLWQMWLIEGYGDQVVIFMKMHHATVDGVSGANLMSHLCSLEPDSAPLASNPTTGVEEEPRRRDLFLRGLLTQISRPVLAVRLLSPSYRLVARSIGRARSGTAMAAPFTAPRTSFNGTITAHRAVGFAEMSLADVKAVKTATGTTINDVVLAVAGGALRAYLERRGELPDTSLVATVPVSVHDSSVRSGGANKVSALFARLGTDVADPLERLQQLAVSNRNAKEHQRAVPADALQDWAEFAAPSTFGLAMRAYAGLRLAEHHPVVHNLVISNVPGPPVPLYYAGAQVKAMIALGPVFHGAGLNITVLSNDGNVHVGILACRDAMPDVSALAREFPLALGELLAAVRA